MEPVTPRSLLLLIVAASLLDACGSAPPMAKATGVSYVPWLALAPKHHYIEAPPATPPALPRGTPECKASQLEGESLGEGAATGNVNMQPEVCVVYLCVLEYRSRA